ncbi:MAG: 50S ribosomal protein P1 [Candidatus Hermodarchaeota archaeon]|nr:50S ribosomal protein P1 [Candidatus Hermodarchaeota archaeon]
MEYIYSAMLLHKAGKKVNAAGLTKVLEAAGVTPDEGRIKALVATLKDINIDEAVKAVPVAAAPAAAPAAAAAPADKPKKEKPKKEEEEEEKPEEVAGLGALFG